MAATTPTQWLLAAVHKLEETEQFRPDLLPKAYDYRQVRAALVSLAEVLNAVS
jgi:hypothetical protein